MVDVVWIYLALIAGLAALVLAYFYANQVMAAPQGSDRMKEISAAISDGANAFLRREYTWVAAFVVLESSSDLEDIRVDLKAIIRFSEDELGRHKRPRDYQVVEALPMTTTGKVMRHKLATLGLSQHL